MNKDNWFDFIEDNYMHQSDANYLFSLLRQNEELERKMKEEKDGILFDDDFEGIN